MGLKESARDAVGTLIRYRKLPDEAPVSSMVEYADHLAERLENVLLDISAKDPAVAELVQELNDFDEYQ
jgi:hypothetical protein